MSNQELIYEKKDTQMEEEEPLANSNNADNNLHHEDHSPKLFNWQQNIVFHPPSVPTEAPAQNQNEDHNDRSNEYELDGYYKLIVTEPTYWTKICQDMTLILESTTSGSFRHVLTFIQGLTGFSDISLLEHFLRSQRDEEKQDLLTITFPGIIKLILETSRIFPTSKEVPILVQGKAEKVALTREQCACLLAHMFMCLTVKQPSDALPIRYGFGDLYSAGRDAGRDAVKMQKIACILHYFKTILTTSSPFLEENVTFARLCLDERYHGESDIKAWSLLAKPMQGVKIDVNNKIEDTQNSIEIDFANKHLGGGALGLGSVQEEIQFITRPEQLVALLFCESMMDNEAILIRGAHIYSGYKGYAETFVFSPSSPLALSSNNSVPPFEREILAIDAIDFSNLPPHLQYREDFILRELNKAFVGFNGEMQPSDLKKPISTGNWGCGCFKGDAELKFLLQWMAASRAERQLVFHPPNTADIHKFRRVMEIYQDQTIEKLFKDVITYAYFVSYTKITKTSFFDLLINHPFSCL